MELITTQVHRLTLLILLLLITAGCDKMGDVTSGIGSATKNLSDKISGEKSPASQSAAGTIGGPETDAAEQTEADEEDSETESEPAVTGARADEFDLVFEMSHQSCSSCGIWFDSAELVIAHSQGKFTARQSGSLLIKTAPYFQGRFKADISSIPSSATIDSATLYMLLNRHEGISNDDFTSSISVYDYVGGNKTYIREITARDDIKGKGYSKANPNVPIDFTDYATTRL